MRKISLKLIFSFFFLVTLALLISGGVFFISYTQTLHHSETEALRELAEEIFSYMTNSEQHPVSDPEFPSILQQISNYESVTIVVRNVNRKVLYTVIPDNVWINNTAPNFSPPWLQKNIFSRGRGFDRFANSLQKTEHFLPLRRQKNERKKENFRGLHPGSVEITIPQTLSGNSPYLIALFRPQRISDKFLRAAGSGFIISSFIALIASILTGIFLGKKITRPIINLKEAALSMAEGNYQVRAECESRDETADLAESFNILGKRLEKRIQELQEERDSLRNFLADASHELRTPLTAMLTSSEILNERLDLSNPQIKELYRQNHQSILRMKTLVDHLLSLSRLQGGIQHLNRQNCPLTETANAAAELIQGNVEFIIDPDLPSAFVDRLSFIQVFRNCFENSLNAGASRIRVDSNEHSNENDGHIVFSITDNGSGIAEKDIPQVTKRFYRGATGQDEQHAQGSRNIRNKENSSGSGLGLAIVREIIHAHGGSLEIFSPPQNPQSAGDSQKTHAPAPAPAQSDSPQNSGQGTEIRFYIPLKS
ncbi:MAG: HAMP domain-containing sensor histidine kinase [Salinispira sp.]